MTGDWREVVGSNLHTIVVGHRRRCSKPMKRNECLSLCKDPFVCPTFAASSRGTISIKKSHMSVFEIAVAISDRCKVRRLFSSAWTLVERD
jgi:hypothetical protein